MRLVSQKVVTPRELWTKKGRTIKEEAVASSCPLSETHLFTLIGNFSSRIPRSFVEQRDDYTSADPHIIITERRGSGIAAVSGGRFSAGSDRGMVPPRWYPGRQPLEIGLRGISRASCGNKGATWWWCHARFCVGQHRVGYGTSRREQGKGGR